MTKEMTVSHTVVTINISNKYTINEGFNEHVIKQDKNNNRSTVKFFIFLYYFFILICSVYCL